VPPVSRPFPRFIADAPREKRPYGRWEERLTAAFATACEPLVEEAGAAVDPESIRWFPERAYAGRVFVPVTADGLRADDDEAPVEYFGHVSFERTDDQEEPGKLRGQADFTDVVADDNPDWQVDLNDDVVAKWFAGGSRGGVAATAELDGEVVDQVGIDDGRFTLVAVDAVTGFGDDLYLEIVLWDRTLQRVIARESLYAEGGDEAEDASAPEDEAS